MEFSWIDLAIAAIIAFSVVRGYIQGFVKAFLSLFLVILALVLANSFSATLSNYFLENSTWTERLNEFFVQKVSSWFGSGISAETWTDSTQTYNIPTTLQNWIEQLTQNVNNTVGNFNANMADALTNLTVNIISFLMIFIAVLIIGKLLIFILNRLSSLPVLRVFNKTGGVLVGAAKGFILVVLLATLLYYLNLAIGSESLSTAINNSFLIRYFYLDFLFG